MRTLFLILTVLAALVFGMGCNGGDLVSSEASAALKGDGATHALWFGPGGTAIEGPFVPVADQTFRLGFDVRPDEPAGRRRSPEGVLLASSEGLLLSVFSDGAVKAAVPGFIDGEAGLWRLDAPAGALATGRWQRLELVYDELRLALLVDGQVVAQTAAYADSAPRAAGKVSLGTSFVGGIAGFRFSTADGETVQEAAFAEGEGQWTYSTGPSGTAHALASPRWIAGPSAG
jgi:hypothetical protein